MIAPLSANTRSVVKSLGVHIQQQHRLALRQGARTDINVDHPRALLLGGARMVGNH